MQNKLIEHAKFDVARLAHGFSFDVVLNKQPMDTIQMYKNFDFEIFMKRRGWSSLLFMIVWALLTLFIAYKTFILK